VTIRNRVVGVVCAATFLLLVVPDSAQATPPQASYPDFPSETPAQFHVAGNSFDYIRREVMIPMRDGVKPIHSHSRSKRREACADSAHAHALRCPGADESRSQQPPWPNLEWL